MRVKPELLAPAGSSDALDNAIMYGADAIYLAGKSFGMRSGANNFSPDELTCAVAKAHEKGVKIYVACNVVARSYELDGIREYLEFLSSIPVDGLIISDLGVMSLARRYAPNIELHVSTQTGVANYETANMLYELGARRVVLARELSLKEIKQLRDNTPADLAIECFVHGSMCVSFSGRCLLSNYLTGRDANHGDCAQPCRWKYHLMEETRPGEYFPVFEDGGTHILNSRDMNMLEHIPELLDCGVSSLKIEGRAKSSYYTAVITNAYRCAIDHLFSENGSEPLPEWIVDETEKVSHREYSTGFYYGNEPGQVYNNGGYVRSYEVAAVVLGSDGEYVTVSQRNRFFRGEQLEVLAPGVEPFMLTASVMLNQDGDEIESAPHPVMTVKIKSDVMLPAGALLRRAKQ